MTDNVQQKPLPHELRDAVRRKDVKAAEELLRRDANVDEKDENGSTTPLMGAVWGEDLEMATLLLDNGADIDAVDDTGTTALIFASGGGDRKLVRLLIDRGADLSISNDFNSTAHSLAKSRNDEKIIEMLENAPEIPRRRAAQAKVHTAEKIQSAAEEAHALAVQRQDRLKALMSHPRRPQP